MRGIVFFPKSPRTPVSTGTSLQPKTFRVSASSSSFTIAFSASFLSGSWLRKDHSNAISATKGPALFPGDRFKKNCRVFATVPHNRHRFYHRRRSLRGWAILARDEIAVRTSLWLASPSIWAISPNPQLSFSSWGLYKPIRSS